MKRFLIIILFFLITIPGCRKNDNPKLSGTDTIDNKLYGTGPYYAIGFSFPADKKISTLNSPHDVITINAGVSLDGNTIEKIYLDVQNFNNSFYRFGEYSGAAAAKQAFDNLTNIGDVVWKASGDSVKVNQVWIFRTEASNFAKFRIISTVAEIRQNKPYAECTFEWVYQPDGSSTFPGK
jgi:hypothetical protein